MEKYPISKINYKESFYDVSRDLGIFDTEIEKSSDLILLWKNQRYIEVYENPDDRQYGRVKKSWIKNDGNIVSVYKGLYHTRISEQNDPLLILALPWDTDKTPRSEKIIDIYFMINHDDIFGERNRFGQSKESDLKNIYLQIAELRNKS